MKKFKFPLEDFSFGELSSLLKNIYIYHAESVFTTTFLSLNNCKVPVRAKMKTQGIPVLSNPSVFHQVPILSL